MSDYAHPELLAETSWLAEHLNDANLRIVDLRFYYDGRDGVAIYRAGHIPGAIHVNWSAALADTTATPANLIPTPEQIARSMGQLGIGNDTVVVGYDDEGGHQASRLWWVLTYYGHRNVKVLNGGIPKWIAEGHPLSQDVPEPALATFVPGAPNRAMRVLADELNASLNNPRQTLADVRRRTEFTGAEARAARGGRIPGSTHIFWQDNLNPDWTFRSADEIRQRYVQAGATPDKRIVTYCQGGVRAAHSALALYLIGFDNVGMYDGSWAEWGNRPDLPIETGDA